MSWQGKKVLVTGADGFIGSHLVEALVSRGAEVRALVYYNSFADWGWLKAPEIAAPVLESIELFPGDIRDPFRTSAAVKGVDVVFHLASLIAIPYSYLAPDSYVQTNIQGGLNVLNACREAGVSRLIHTSTSEVYGSAKYVPIDEDHPILPQSPYAASKAAADMLARSYYLSFGLDVVTVRPFNTFGPRQSLRAVIPTIIGQLLAKQSMIRLGAVTPTRDFTFVSDTVAGFLCAAGTDGNSGEVMNLGTGQEIPIGQLAELLMDIVGHRAEILCDEQRLRPERSEVDRLLSSPKKAERLIGWRPSVSLETGLRLTSEWMAERKHGSDVSRYTM